MLIAIAILFFTLTKNRPVAKVKDYLWDGNKSIMLFLNKNSYYTNGMLVSIYIKEDRRTTLCAVGHVNMDPEGKRVHIQVLHQIDTVAMGRIRNSRNMCKKYLVKPSITQNDVLGISWK